MDPQIGEVRSAKEIGKVGRNKHVWVKCPTCNYARWVNYTVHRSSTLRLCRKCAIHRWSKFFINKS